MRRLIEVFGYRYFLKRVLFLCYLIGVKFRVCGPQLRSVWTRYHARVSIVNAVHGLFLPRSDKRTFKKRLAKSRGFGPQQRYSPLPICSSPIMPTIPSTTGSCFKGSFFNKQAFELRRRRSRSVPLLLVYQ